MTGIQIVGLYFACSFVQALILARAINKRDPMEYPKLTVFLFTLGGIAATATFLAGMVAGGIERFVKGRA